MNYYVLALFLALIWSLSICATSADQLDPQQIQIIQNTAASICNTVKDARGQKTEAQLQGDVKAQLTGLLGKVADVGGSGKGALTREEFEGLSRDATAAALEGDRGCRERVFNKMFDKLSLKEMQNESGNKPNDSLPSTTTISVPCFNGHGSGGWMFDENIPERYFPLVLVEVQEWPPRSIRNHPMYHPDDPEFFEHGTCIVMPARYP